MNRSGNYFRGRPVAYNSDARAIEDERQRWVYEKIEGMNEVITDLAVDPAKEYELHRAEYERTGDLGKLRWALEYVQPEGAV